VIGLYGRKERGQAPWKNIKGLPFLSPNPPNWRDFGLEPKLLTPRWPLSPQGTKWISVKYL